MRCIKVLWAMIIGIALIGTLTFDSFSSSTQSSISSSQEDNIVARIISPSDDDRVPRKEYDPPCPEFGPCTKIYVMGQVTSGYWPFLAVAPLNATPRIWIQPPILNIKKKSGIFTALAYLGTNSSGAGERYNLFIIAHQDKNRFREGDVLTTIPKDCFISDHVTVLRIK